jgi:HEPN domain-containing protein
MRPDSADPRRWLAFARSDLALAREGRHNDDVFLESLCYHCQQAVEKSLKAVLIAHEVDFPRTHNVGTLAELLPDAAALPDTVPGDVLRGLSAYAILSRYPGDLEDVSGADYEQALAVASLVVEWAGREVDSSRPGRRT